MSRAYRITVSESVRREIVSSDEVRTRLELLAILPGVQTAEILRAELQSRGFRDEPDGTMVRTTDDLTVTVDPCSGEVSARIDRSAELTADSTRTATAWDDLGDGLDLTEAKTRRLMKEELEKKLDRDATRKQEETTRELDQRLADLQPELSTIVNKVTREALKVRARQLGTVVDVVEDENTGSLTIKVEV